MPQLEKLEPFEEDPEQQKKKKKKVSINIYRVVEKIE